MRKKACYYSDTSLVSVSIAIYDNGSIYYYDYVRLVLGIICDKRRCCIAKLGC